MIDGGNKNDTSSELVHIQHCFVSTFQHHLQHIQHHHHLKQRHCSWSSSKRSTFTRATAIDNHGQQFTLLQFRWLAWQLQRAARRCIRTMRRNGRAVLFVTMQPIVICVFVVTGIPAASVMRLFVTSTKESTAVPNVGLREERSKIRVKSGR